MDFQTQKVLLGAAGAGGESSWALRIYKASTDVQLKDMVVDSTGNIYVVGNTTAGAIWKLDKDANILWTFLDTNTNALEYTSVALDSSGNLYVTGYDPSGAILVKVSSAGALITKSKATNASLSFSGQSTNKVAVSSADKVLYKAESTTAYYVALNFNTDLTTGNWRKFVNTTGYPRYRWERSASDGAGGFLLSGNSDTAQYAPSAQRIDSTGANVWIKNLYTNGTYQVQSLKPRILTDGTYVYTAFPRYDSGWSRIYFGMQKRNLSDGTFVAQCSCVSTDGDSGSYNESDDADRYGNNLLLSGYGKSATVSAGNIIWAAGIPNTLSTSINFQYLIKRSDNTDIAFQATRGRFVSEKSFVVMFVDRDATPNYYGMLMKLPVSGAAIGKSANMTVRTYNIVSPNWIYAGGDYASEPNTGNSFASATNAGATTVAMTPSTPGTSTTKVTL